MRKICAVTLSIFLLFAISGRMAANRHQDVAEKKVLIERTSVADREHFLQVWYDGPNEAYFSNRLPKNIVIHYRPIENDAAMGSVDCSIGPVCTITIDPRFNIADITAIMTMYHEECHIAVWVDYGESAYGDPGHGKLFQACMMDLAKQGAFEKIW